MSFPYLPLSKSYPHLLELHFFFKLNFYILVYNICDSDGTIDYDTVDSRAVVNVECILKYAPVVAGQYNRRVGNLCHLTSCHC